MKEEKGEVYEAAKKYKETPRTGTLIDLKKEFGDLLYTVCCLANSYEEPNIKKTQWKIPLDETFEKTTKEDIPYNKRQAKLNASVDMLEKALIKDAENIGTITKRIGELLFAIYAFVPVCCENDPEIIDLDHGFAMIIKKNKQRNKEGYVKKEKK